MVPSLGVPMRRALSAIVLFASVAASVATSKLPTKTTTTSFRGPVADVTDDVPASYTLDVLATQSPSGPFDGAALVLADVTAAGPATVTATLSLMDGSGATELARDTVVLSSGAGELFLFDDLHAFAGCADGATCDQAFQLVFHTSGDADVDWTFEADLYDVDELGRTGELSVHLR